MSLRLSVLAFAAIVTASIAGGSVVACAAGTSADEAFVKRLFGGPADPQKSYACFVRTYDASHLAHHPLKKVKAMKLLVTAEPEPESKALVYSFRLTLQYRDRRGVFNSSGECGRAETADAGQFGCGVDCDGGGIEVALAKDDKSILVKVERIRIWRANAPDDDAPSQSQLGGADDRLFRLDRARLDDCKSLVTDREELATLRHK